jgi:predicted fused transcriptional regulator/phosphomethylpyrimidine kinase
VLPACFHLADAVFPRVRAAAAHHLAAAGWSQARIAQALGLSQAMVSRHLAAPAPADDPLVRRLADELVAELKQPGSGAATSCDTIALVRPGAGADALQDLLAAERLLLADPPLRLMPQIGLNVARARPDADGPAAVASFPGRLVEAGGRVVSPAPPAFGASGHLARCLLALRAQEGGAGLHALASVRGGADVASAARRLGWAVAALERDTADRDGDAEAAFRRACRAPLAQALHDPGAVGIEPCLYIPARDARAAAGAILKLHERLVNP